VSKILRTETLKLIAVLAQESGGEEAGLVAAGEAHSAFMPQFEARPRNHPNLLSIPFQRPLIMGTA
jgi:hypothetical protein